MRVPPHTQPQTSTDEAASATHSHQHDGRPAGRLPRYPGAAGRGFSRLAFGQLDRWLRQAGCAVRIKLWDESDFDIGQGVPSATLVIHDPQLASSLWWGQRPWKLARAYIQGRMDIEGDLFDLLRLRHVIEAGGTSRIRPETWREPRSISWPEGALRWLAQAWLPWSRLVAGLGRHSRRADSDAIAMHYDVPLAFYDLWLDAQRVYSCAYFEHPEDSLDQAQRNKMDLVCRKLRLQPGERLLDVGCGWGGLLFWAARHYGVNAHGITLSQAQQTHVRRRIHEEQLEDRISVSLLDYRDLPPDGSFDKACSIGMAEHVGLGQMDRYLASVRHCIRPGGLFLLHSITQDKTQAKSPAGGAFMERFVFPGGELDSISHLQVSIEHAGFEIHDVESLRQHYGMTLRHWVRRLQLRAQDARQVAGERALRTWLLYMAACAIDFEEGGLGVYQILVSSRGADPSLPLSREDLCNRGASRAGTPWRGPAGGARLAERGDGTVNADKAGRLAVKAGMAAEQPAQAARPDCEQPAVGLWGEAASPSPPPQAMTLPPGNFPFTHPVAMPPKAALETAPGQDPLTGLFWGEAMLKCLRRGMLKANATGQSVQLVDLDVRRFESVNDRHGYSGGDRLLRAIADRLVLAVRGRGEVFRVGSNEFVVLVASPDGQCGSALARELREAALHPGHAEVKVPGQDLELGVGHASHPGPASGPEQLLRAARMSRLAGGFGGAGMMLGSNGAA